MAKPSNVINHIVRYSGLFIIFIFAGISIFLTTLENNILKDISYAAKFENSFYDYRMVKYVNENHQGIQDKNVVLAAIDDESLQTIGRWPWTRTRLVEFIKKMKDAGAKVVAFDIILSEPELACNAASPDIALMEAIKDFQSIPGNKIIMAYSLTDEQDSHFKEFPDTLFNVVVDSKQAGESNFTNNKVSDTTFPVAEILKAEPGMGYISMSADHDGVFRHYPVVSNVDGFHVPALGLTAFEAFTGKKVSVEVHVDGNGSLKIDKNTLKLNTNGEARIRYIGDDRNFPAVSLKTILDPKVNIDDLRAVFNGRIVFIGSTAFAANDIRNTPINSVLPGVYVHMNFTSMMLKNYFFKPTDDSIRLSLYLLVIGTLLILLVQQFIGNTYIDILALIATVSATYFLDQFYFLPKGYEVKLFFCFFSYVLTYSWNTFLNFAQANKEKKQIKGTFSRYVAPAIVNQMLSDPDKLVLGGEKKNITCIFSDVRDFTSISEKLTPTQLSQCLNIYMSKMTNILFDTFGTLDKYIGDAIVGYWGAPLEIENHAYHAVRGSLQMVEALPEINQQFKQQGFPEFKIGIGLNSGECSVGNMGSDKIFSYTALGDNMNLGSRLESLCKYYGVQINISEFTYEAIPKNLREEFKFRRLDIVRVKGKENPVKTYEVLPSFHPFFKDQKSLDLYEQAYSHYLNKKFLECLQIIDELCGKYPEDKPSKLLKANAEYWLENKLPDDWDGVTTHKEK